MKLSRSTRKALVCGGIAVLCALIGWGIWSGGESVAVVRLLDDVFYDAWYRVRPGEPKVAGPIVIVAVDDPSIEAVDQWKKYGWPWPREFWGHMIKYLDQAGARAAVFDLLFDRSSVYNSATDDDQQFADVVNAAKIPVVLATWARADGTTWDIAPPIAPRRLGAANVSGQDIIRTYNPVVHGNDSLARRAAALSLTARAVATGPATATPQGRLPDWAGAPFRLHYYGPHSRDGKPVTFQYVRAAHLLSAALDPKTAAGVGITPGMFKDKIVFFATITAGTYDLKASPLSGRYPGVEVHATALQNMLEDRRVTPMSSPATLGLSLLACLLAAAATVYPARVGLKITGGLMGPAIVLGASLLLFAQGRQIRWLAPAGPLVGTALCAFAALGYSYLTELRQRRFVLKALAQYVSKEVADEIARDPSRVTLGGVRRDMTVMFTDLANFTTLSESLEPENVEKMLNAYLHAMSGVILGNNGTVDKYIGDAIMCFWNAPTNQPDHAILACRTALKMQAREDAMKEELRELAGGAKVHSRSGINSGPMVVGNMGSELKLAYTVLGDVVNLASRLEGANKAYGTRILLSETTARLVQGQFVVRKIDLMKLKGKNRPIAVFELIAEGPPDPGTADLIARYEGAFDLYQQRKFDEARSVLLGLKKDFPSDGPTATLLGRVEDLLENPPEADWDGIYVAKDK